MMTTDLFEKRIIPTSEGRDSFAPAIKWSGSKRKMAMDIICRLPKHIKTYYEPFCGGCSVLRRLLSDTEITVEHYVCSDLNETLIDFWNTLKQDADGLADSYELHWKALNADADIERKKSYFNCIRERFNDRQSDWYHSPSDFLFIVRTCTNGLPRYNSDGHFNNSFHLTRNGIAPDKLRSILNTWSRVINEKHVEFIHQPYWYVKPGDGDVMFLDPPYAGTKGMYFGNFNVAKFFSWLRRMPKGCSYALTFDGKAGEDDMTYPVPEDVYDKHEYLTSGNSAFRRVIGNGTDTVVYESLYTKGCCQ